MHRRDHPIAPTQCYPSLEILYHVAKTQVYYANCEEVQREQVLHTIFDLKNNLFHRSIHIFAWAKDGRQAIFSVIHPYYKVTRWLSERNRYIAACE